MDGVDPLPDQDPTEGPNGDESARPSVQPEAGAEYLRNAEADCVHERLGPNRPKSNPAVSLATAPRSPAGYTRERLTTRFHTASTRSRRCRFFCSIDRLPCKLPFAGVVVKIRNREDRTFANVYRGFGQDSDPNSRS